MTPPQALLSKFHRLFNLRVWRVGVVLSLGGWGGVPVFRGFYVSSLARRILLIVS